MANLKERLAQLEQESDADRKALLEQDITLDQWQARATERSIAYANIITHLDMERARLARLSAEFRQQEALR